MKSLLSHLPAWPPLSVSFDDGWAQICTEHDTFIRLQIAEVLRVFLFMFCLIGALYCIDIRSRIGFLMVLLIIAFLCYEKFPLILCTTLFPKQTDVVFEYGTITINGKSYEISPHIDAQFRAGQKYLNERQEQIIRSTAKGGVLSAMALHKVSYRKVEMIYGGNIILIAVVSDQDKAAQFAYVLQEAWRISRTFNSDDLKTNKPDIVE